MKAKHNSLLDDDSRFDGLVDGVLSAAEYESLLSSLEDEPGGWRRCAMAFLEAQAWRKEFAAIRRVEEDGFHPKVAEPVERPAKRMQLWSLSPMLAAAACAILAFGLGLATHNSFYPTDPLPTRFAGHGSEAISEGAHEPGSADDQEIAAMKFVIDGAGNHEVVVPVIGEGHPGEETLVETEPALPDSVLRALRSRGHNIQRQQQFIPVATGDGRHVIFPVEQYKITPVSSRSY